MSRGELQFAPQFATVRNMFLRNLRRAFDNNGVSVTAIKTRQEARDLHVNANEEHYSARNGWRIAFSGITGQSSTGFESTVRAH